MKRALLALSSLAVIGAAPAPAVLHVDVSNVRGHTGTVHVDICTQAQFLKDCPRSADAAAVVGVTRVTLNGLPPGRYAAQVFYDENGNHKVDRALFGIPKEGVGFSNDAKIRFSPPKWEEAMFDYDGGSRVIKLRLRYFIGPDAPR
ncbi:DUF2141 domain-containing protein [Sphingomonas sp. RT2P30]|uniref:DUF2141 domain-containing protein n=1 Tax=Parasphingomonas halimpatiens TaxID=3096162 RepID=UPI002FCBC3DE